MHYYATYFDRNYLSRGLVLYESLVKNDESFELFILCLDTTTKTFFQQRAKDYPQVKLILIEELEANDIELLSCKGTRTQIEYYFTLSPCLPLFILEKFDLPHICTLDADILFLDDPKDLFDYLTDYSIIITPHKFSPELKVLEKYGLYNVSFQIFKNDDEGIACLSKWREQCIDWCHDFLDELKGYFADQKYLDDWTIRYPGKVKVLDDTASGLAPWNLNNYIIEKKKDKFLSNGTPIIFCHFHHYRFFSKNWASNGFHTYSVRSYKALSQLYLRYWRWIDKKKDLANVDTDDTIRQHFSGDLVSILNREISVFFKFNRYLLWSLDLQKLHPFIKRVLFKFYGKAN